MQIPDPLPSPGCRHCKKPMVETLVEGIHLCPRCDRAPRPNQPPLPPTPKESPAP